MKNLVLMGQLGWSGGVLSMKGEGGAGYGSDIGC